MRNRHYEFDMESVQLVLRKNGIFNRVSHIRRDGTAQRPAK